MNPSSSPIHVPDIQEECEIMVESVYVPDLPNENVINTEVHPNDDDGIISYPYVPDIQEQCEILDVPNENVIINQDNDNVIWSYPYVSDMQGQYEIKPNEINAEMNQENSNLSYSHNSGS